MSSSKIARPYKTKKCHSDTIVNAKNDRKSSPKLSKNASKIDTKIDRESGAEKVSIQPLAGQKKKAASSGGGNITINISAPLVDDTIVDVIIPKIKEAAKLNLA